MLTCKALHIVMKKLLAAPLLFTTLFSIAQNDPVSSHQKDSLFTSQELPFLQPRLNLNGKTMRPRKAKDIFNAVPASVPYYKKYRNRFAIGLVSAGITVLTAV